MLILELALMLVVGQLVLGTLVWVTSKTKRKPVEFTFVALTEEELDAARDAYNQGIKHSIYWETEGMDNEFFKMTGQHMTKESTTKRGLTLIKTAPVSY